jgi:hypothetical protein
MGLFQTRPAFSPPPARVALGGEGWGGAADSMQRGKGGGTSTPTRPHCFAGGREQKVSFLFA